MTAHESPYYPPRAGRGAVFWRLWQTYRRQTPTLRRMVSARIPDISVPWFVFPILIVPFLGLHLASPPLVRKIGKIAGVLCAVIALVYFDARVGGFALGLLATLHALGVNDYLQATQPIDSPIKRGLRRAALAIGFAFALTQLFPLVIGRIVVRVGASDGRIVLINPHDLARPEVLGEKIALSIGALQFDHMWISSGTYLGTVFGRGGELVEFSPGEVRVNGVVRPAASTMPPTGTLQVPIGRTLLWPEGLRIRGASDSQLLRIVEHFMVDDSALVGRPYKRWFWRTQTPTP